MNNEIMGEATDTINQQDDKNMPSVSLGSSSPEIDLTKQETNDKEYKTIEGMTIEEKKLYNELRKQTKETEKKPENDIEKEIKKETHGELLTELENIYKEIEKYKNEINEIETIIAKNGSLFKHTKKDTDKMKELFEKYGIETKSTLNYTSKEAREMLNEIIPIINKKTSELYNKEKEIKENPVLDNRTDEQKREDTAAQRKVEDYQKAGLNPAAVSGYYGSGGGGGGSSSDNAENERKRKKREEELAKQQKEKEQREMIFKIISLIGGLGTGIGGTMLYGNALKESANIRNTGLYDREELRGVNNMSLQELKNIGNRKTEALRQTGQDVRQQKAQKDYWDRIYYQNERR